jgi:HK97 gp10 family phage protein
MATRIQGLDRLNAKLRALPNQVAQPVRNAIATAALTVQTEAQNSVRQPGRGRVYKRGSRTHQASAPGDPPASDTGRLLGSIETTLLDNGFAAEVGTGVAYGRHLEFGTSKIAPRPWLFPALEKHRVRITEHIANAVRSALRRR